MSTASALMGTPLRFTEYFFVCGARADESLAINKPATAAIQDRYPKEDRRESPFPDGLHMFCFPCGLVPRSARDVPRFFSFALTALDGARTYGSCLLFSEDQSEVGASVHMFVPKVLGVVHRFPFFEAYRKALVYVYSCGIGQSAGLEEASVEKLIHCLTCVVPIPPPMRVESKRRVVMHLAFGGDDIVIERPRVGEPICDQLRFDVTCQSLDVGNIISLVTALLTEKRVLIHSSKMSLLSTVAETIQALLYPFAWSYVYIPILPHELLEFLMAPTPYLMGIHTAYVNEAMNVIAGSGGSVVTVDLDNNRIYYDGGDGAIPTLPEPEGSNLRTKLERLLHPQLWAADFARPWDRDTYAPASPTDPEDYKAYVRDSIREAFLEFFTSILRDYRSYIVVIKDEKRRMTMGRRSSLAGPGQPVVLINKSKFLRSSERFQAAMPFMLPFVESQLFSGFLQNRQYPMMDTFDMIIQRKTDLLLPPDPEIVNIDIPQNSKGMERRDSAWGGSGPIFPELRHEEFLEAGEPQPLGGPVDEIPEYDEDAIEEEGAMLSGSRITPQSQEEMEDMVAGEEAIRSLCATSLFGQEVLQSGASTGWNINKNDFETAQEVLRKPWGPGVLVEVLREWGTKNVLAMENSAFEALVELVMIALATMDENKDFVTAFKMSQAVLPFNHTIFVNTVPKDESLESRIRGAEIFQSIEFWECALDEGIAQEQRFQRGEAARRASSNINETASRWTALSEQEQEEKEMDIVFGQIGNIAHQMLSSGVEEGTVRDFVAEMSAGHKLGTNHVRTLNNLLDNMLQAAKMFQEDTMKSKHRQQQQKEEKERKEKEQKEEAKADKTQARKAATNSGRWVGGGVFSKREKNDGETKEPEKTEDKCEDEPEAANDRAPSTGNSLDTIREAAASISATVPVMAEADFMGEHAHTPRAISESVISTRTTESIEEKRAPGIGGFLEWRRQNAEKKRVEKNWINLKYAETVGKTHVSPLLSMAYDRKNSRLATGSAMGRVCLWQKGQEEPLHEFTDHTAEVKRLILHDDMLISSSYDGNVVINSATTHERRLVLPGTKGPVTSLAYDHSRLVACGHQDGAIALWDIGPTEVKCVDTIEVLNSQISQLHFEKNLIMAASRDATIRIWDAATCQVVTQFTDHTCSVVDAYIIDRKIVSASADGEVRVWDTRSTECVKVFNAGTAPINCLHWSAGSMRYVVVGSSDNKVRVYDLKVGKCINTLEGHTDEVASCKLFRNQVVTGSFDNTVGVWKIGNPKPMQLIKGHTGWVSQVDLDESHLFSISWDHTVRIRDFAG